MATPEEWEEKLCLLVDVRWYLNLTKKLEELFSLDN
jgi:hypothetical protein